METKIYKVLFTLLIAFLLLFAAVNWAETVTFSQRVVNFIDALIGASHRQPAAIVGVAGDETTSESSTTGGTGGTGGTSGGNGNTNTPPPPPPPGQNQAPQVSAGADQTNVDLSIGATLNAVVTDDGKPNPPSLLGMFWSEVSGPEQAVFTAPNSASTHVSFSSDGEYVLRLSVFDGEFFTTDDVAIIVTTGSNSGNNNGSNNGNNTSPPPGSPNSPSVDELMARIRELQEMLRNLQAGGSGTQSSSYVPTSGSSASLDLKLGSTGPAVTALQKFLVAKKFLKMPAGSAYGTFGPATKAALAKFQAAHLIYPANGYYGLVTRKLVNQLR